MLLLLLACSSDPAPSTDAPVAAPAPPRDTKADAQALAEGNAALSELSRSFRTRLTEELSERGPVAAVEVCSTEATALTAALSASTGGRVGRSSSKLRNPANAGPEWVQAWLEAADASSSGLSEVEGDTARVLKPILVEPGAWRATAPRSRRRSRRC